jgi:hypothetical protein
VKDHGIFRDGSKEIPEAQHPLYRRTLLQDLNRQGAVVLEGKTLGNFYPFLFYVFLPETVLFHNFINNFFLLLAMFYKKLLNL